MTYNSPAIVSFMLGEAPDHRGRYIEGIWQMNDFELEYTHDYIQWLFPIPEPGRFNQFAPTLDGDARRHFQANVMLRQNQTQSFQRMVEFFGLVYCDNEIGPSPNLSIKDHIWLKAGGHNHLRITRMIRSLHLCHQPGIAQQFQRAMIEIGLERGHVSDSSVSYWQLANQ